MRQLSRKALLQKPDDVSLVPGIHMVEKRATATMAWVHTRERQWTESKQFTGRKRTECWREAQWAEKGWANRKGDYGACQWCAQNGKSIERGIMGRVVLCFACVCITNIQQTAGEDCHYECFLSPSCWIWLHILFQNKKLSLCKVRLFLFQLQPSLPCTLQLLPEAAGPGRMNS